MINEKSMFPNISNNEEGKNIWLSLIKRCRDNGKFEHQTGNKGKYSPPYTPETLINEIFGNILTNDKSINIGVMFTIEMAVILKFLGYKNITVITDNKDIIIQKLTLEMGYKYWYLKDKKAEQMKFDVIVGNPPYNDGSTGKSPIYQKFLEKLINLQLSKVVFIIPTNWFSQNHNKLGKNVRYYLRKLGVKSINMNSLNAFDNAVVNTCTVYCSKNYNSNIEIVFSKSLKTKVIKDFEDQILMEDNPVGLSLLQRLKPLVPYTIHSGNKGNTNKYRIVTSYIKMGFEIEPINPLSIMEPNYKNQKGYRVFTECNTLKEARVLLPYYNSYWCSKLIKTILIKTRSSVTLDNPQLRWVPISPSLTKIWTDEELYKYFNLTQEEIDYIEKTVKQPK